VEPADRPFDPASNPDAARAAEVIALVESLTHQGLLQVATSGNGDEVLAGPRLTMLETVREFAAEELAASRDADTARRHADYYVRLANQASPSFWGDAPGDHRALLGPELGNLRAALAWATEHGEADTALQLASALFDPHWMFDPQWLAGGAAHDQRVWTQRALALPGGTPRHRVTALTSAACLAWAYDDLVAEQQLLSEAMALARASGDNLGVATAEFLLGRAAFLQNDAISARRWLSEALAGFRALEAPGRAAWALCFLASLDSRRATDEGGDPAALARAAGLCEEALATFEAVDYPPGIIRARHGRAYVAYKQRDLGRSLELAQELLALAWERRSIVHNYLADIADIAGRIGQAEVAARLYGAAHEDRARHEGQRQMPLVYQMEAERDMAIARRALGEAAFAAAWAAGRATPLDRIVAEALALAPPSSADPSASLSPREREIVRLLADGLTDRAIGAALFLSRRTVEHHVARLRAKLGAATRAEAVVVARDRGLLPSRADEP
jgi:non-specific serine/threonine protein kinase